MSVDEPIGTLDAAPPPTPRLGVRGGATGPASRRWLTSDAGARATSYVTGLVLWTVLGLLFERIPGPDEVAVNLWQEFARGEVFGNFATTIVRFFSGVAVAAVAGIVIGLLIGLSKLWRAALGDVVLVGLTIPAFVWAFLTVMWFGLGGQAAISATVLSATPFVAVNVAKGVTGISRNLRDMSRAYGVPAKRWVRHLALPAVTGFIVAGVRFGMIIGWNATLLAEWFGSADGVGFRARYWYDANRFGGFAAWVILFIVFIVALDVLVLERLSRRAFAWRDAQTDSNDA